MTPAKYFSKYSILLAISGIIGYNPVESDLNHTSAIIKDLPNGLETTNRGIKDFLVCTFCKSTVKLLFKMIKNGDSDEKITQKVLGFCPLVSYKITANVCEGLIKSYSTDLLYILRRLRMKSESGPESEEICNFGLGESCGGDLFNKNHDWKVVIPSVPKPSETELPVRKMDAPIMKVLHISDTHYDPYYEEGSNADCKEPMCCRATSGKAASPDAAAGKWSDFRKCDTPKRTIDNMLDHIVKTHKDIDYILWTGDLPPHDIWNQSKSTNLENIRESVRQITEKFPGIPVFPAVGNHESVPMGSFPPPNVDDPRVSIDWLNDELDKLWSRWLPKSASKTVRRGAFYSVLLRPGLRIISLNSNYCYDKNMWLLLNSTDPANQLQWLIDELQKAEDSVEKVHIIGHIPPGHTDCLEAWSRNFYQIIARYENTVAGQFYGHTHFDEFEVFYDPGNTKHATNIAYIAPSVSTYEDLNPGYRIYYVDGDHQKTTRLVIDHETWIMNLREANLQETDEPVWYKLYSARSAYGMEALRPKDWSELIEKMDNNRDLFEQYYKYYWKDSPVRPNCDEKCRKRLICDCKTGRSHDRKEFCHEEKTFLENIFGTL